MADEGDTGDTIFTFTVTRFGDLAGTVTVDYRAEGDGNATVGVDYVDASGTITFLDGEEEQVIDIIVNGDTEKESDELFSVHLSNPDPDTVTLSDSVGQGIIQNDDPAINLSQTIVNVTEGGATAVVTFTLKKEPLDDVTIELTPDGQCSVIPTEVTLSPGIDGNWDTGIDVTIRAIDDDVDEGIPHSCTVTVSNSVSNDPDFHDINLPDIQGNITDNDGGGGNNGNPTPTPIVVNNNTATPMTPTTPTPIIPTSTPGPTATSPVPGMASVSGEVRGLALRTGPYLGATLIGSADAGFEYPILARNHDEGGEYAWYLIQVGEVKGWVSGRYLNFIGFAHLLPVQGSIFDQVDGAPDIGVFGTTFSINDLRRRPSGRAQIITQIPANTRVSIIGRTRQNGGDFWYQVRYNGLVGWIPAFVDRGNTSSVPIR